MQFQFGDFVQGLSQGIAQSREKKKNEEERKLRERIAKDQESLRVAQEQEVRSRTEERVRKGEGEKRQEGQRERLRDVVRDSEMEPDTTFAGAGVEPPTPSGRSAHNVARGSAIRSELIPLARPQDLPGILGLQGANQGTPPRSFQSAAVAAIQRGEDPTPWLNQSRDFTATQMPGLQRRIADLETMGAKRSPGQTEALNQLKSLAMELPALQGYGGVQGKTAAELNMPSPTALLPTAPQPGTAPAPTAPTVAALSAIPGARPGETPRQVLKRTDEQSQQSARPLEAGDRDIIVGMEENLKVADALKKEFTKEELTRYVGAIKNPMQRFSQLFRNPDSAEAVKFARFKALTDTVKGFAFAEGGKALTNTEKLITFGHLPIGNEFNLANYISNLDITTSRTKGLIEGRIRYATTPRGDLGQGAAPKNSSLPPNWSPVR